MQDNQTSGKVIIAGAGPGDPDLITVKATRYLAQADIILTDRLVSDEILKCYANPSATITYVGKQCRSGHSTSQETINALMVRHALEGKLVVRLKGGDSTIFSNVLDELLALKEANIEYEIIPGITAAAGAAAYAGIPLTARGHATAIRLLTYYRSDIVSPEHWRELARTTDTLVFYMSADTAKDVVTHLVRGGTPKDRYIALIEQATTPYQQVHCFPLHEFHLHQDIQLLSPSLLIIGTVAALHQEFGWIKNSAKRELYFKPVGQLSLKDDQQNLLQHVTRA